MSCIRRPMLYSTTQRGWCMEAFCLDACHSCGLRSCLQEVVVYGIYLSNVLALVQGTKCLRCCFAFLSVSIFKCCIRPQALTKRVTSSQKDSRTARRVCALPSQSLFHPSHGQTHVAVDRVIAEDTGRPASAQLRFLPCSSSSLSPALLPSPCPSSCRTSSIVLPSKWSRASVAK
jgi:hypothetical protein